VSQPIAAIEPFILSIPDEVLEDLKRRLAATRWPEDAPLEPWRQGVPVADMKRLRDHWLHRYDWRRCEKTLNGFGQSRTRIDGLEIHFLHVRSSEPDAMPLILTHGWPGSIIEYVKVVAPLADPRACGGEAGDAFHLVIPSLPGYGFSEKPKAGEWSTKRIAKAWIELMRRLGYGKFVANGGDWGGGVTTDMAAIAPPELRAVHLNMPVAFPESGEMDSLSAKERESLASLERQTREGRGYSEQQRTKPQTLGYALVDSPIGQAAWIYDKFRDWSDCRGDPLNSYSMDELLDNIMMYWLPGSGASSARLYATEFPADWDPHFAAGAYRVSVGVSIFPGEIYRPARRWVERKYGPLMYWNELERGGHFAAFEQPELFVTELRNSFRGIRGSPG
jgi:pimeloyl-ACP methyl ester carboxylesterase